MDKTTTDHKEIQQWVEKHQGRPEMIDHPTALGDKVGLRINFPGSNDEEFLSADTQPKYIPWDKFFKIFDEQELAFMYTDAEKMLDPSYAYRFIKRSAVGEESAAE